MNPRTIAPNGKTYTNGNKPGSHHSTRSTFKSVVLPANIHLPVDQITAVLAHEVRNPLTNINLSVELLGTAVKEIELRGYLDVIRRSVSRINHLIGELLKHHATDEERVECFSINQLLDEVVRLAEDRIQLKNVVVSKVYDKQDHIVFLNKEKIKNALTNIIINAIDAMNVEHGELKLVTKSTENGYIIRIEDNGCGISKSNIKRIFTPFYSNKPGGLGLGLATTYDILRANQIRIKVASKEGKGTRFSLLLEKTSGSISQQD